MHPSQRSFPFVEGNVALRHFRFQTLRFEFLLAKCPGKETTLVRASFQFDYKCPGQLSLLENQVSPAAHPAPDQEFFACSTCSVSTVCHRRSEFKRPEASRPLM